MYFDIVSCKRLTAYQVSGADYAMEGFVKVSGRRPEEGQPELAQETNGHAKSA